MKVPQVNDVVTQRNDGKFAETTQIMNTCILVSRSTTWGVPVPVSPMICPISPTPISPHQKCSQFQFCLQLCVRVNICVHMRGSRNFHERGSNENGNFWSQTRGGPTPQKSRNYLFLDKIFKFHGGSGPPAPPSGSAHVCS